MESDTLLHDLLSQLGEFGPYQLRQHLLHLCAVILAGLHIFSLTTVGATPKHRCFIPEIDSHDVLNGTPPSFDASLLYAYIPTSTGKLDSCRKYASGQSGDDEKHVRDCEGQYVYDTTYYQSSRVIEMSLVCERKWLRALMQSSYMIGVLIGAVVLGSLADRLGRKKVLYVSIVLQLFFGLAAAFVTNIWAYLGVLLFYGMFGSAGAYVTAFVLTMEIVGPSKRTICGVAVALAYSVGAMLVALWGSLIKDAFLLQIVYALHSAFLLPWWWTIDESIVWLWRQGRREEALEIAKKAIKTNGREFMNRYDDVVSVVAAPTTPSEPQAGFINLLKLPVQRGRMLIMSFAWLSNSLVYYGLSLSTGELLGNPFLMIFLIALAETPAYIIVILLRERVGRRPMCSSMMIVGGVGCIIAAVIPGGLEGTILVMLGKCSIAGSYAIVFYYTAEMFPTAVRNSAVGFAAMSAKLSGALTPWISSINTHGLNLPVAIFGTVAMIAALFTLLLPETLGKDIPHTIQQGEEFQQGDNAYKALWNFIARKLKKPKEDIGDDCEQVTITLQTLPETR